VLDGDPRSLGAGLAAHEATLDDEIHDLVRKLDKVRSIRSDLARGQRSGDCELARLLDPAEMCVAFQLPWPWGGEWFELRDVRPLIVTWNPTTLNTKQGSCMQVESSSIGCSRLMAVPIS